MIVLEQPIGWSGQVKQSPEHHWILESFSDGALEPKPRTSTFNFSWMPSSLCVLHAQLKAEHSVSSA